MADIHRGFEDVDSSPEEKSFFEFLDLANQLPSISSHRERMLELSPVKDGFSVLDVGCGLGQEASRIAGLVGKAGRIEGIDGSESLIEEARRRAQDSNVPLNYSTGDARSLPFEDSCFDLCRAERVLLYLENPAQSVAEMARVTRPGGHIIIFDFDYGAIFIDSDFAKVTRQIEALIASEPRNPTIGRGLPHLLRKAKFRVEAIEPMTVIPTTEIARRLCASALSKGIDKGAFTAAEVEVWSQEQETMGQEGRRHHAFHGYIVAASKP
jgi:ubiquinone/menaquinone biosynthesis C-methylase UbiE